MHANCQLCSTLDRAKAYRWLGEPHAIPLAHCTPWLDADITRTVLALTLNDQTVLDYTGEVDNAPVMTLRRDEHDVITAHTEQDGPGGRSATRWEWGPDEDEARRVGRIAFRLLSHLVEQRGTSGVVMMHPDQSLMPKIQGFRPQVPRVE